ncbi:MAG: 1-phosphofructokinase family hexose kinase [Candidatus Omnitrophica bacterium]|nr:1-phosphofructokinase family hexose kinase [Candidatus Omnitrophota bacterium]
MSNIVTVTLNPALDKFISVDHLRPGYESLAGEVSIVAGGKGVNVSRALRQFVLLSVRAIGFAGGNSGEHLKQLLEVEKIPNEFYLIHGQTRSNYTFIDNNGQRTRVLEPGPLVLFSEWKAFLKKYKILLGAQTCVVLSGRNANGLTHSAYGELIRLAHQNQCCCFLDTSGQPLIEGLKAGPDFIKPNQSEAEEVLGYKLSSINRIKKALKEFYQMGARRVIISRGPEGVVAFDGENFFEAAARVNFKLVNDVGCGDSCVAGFIGNHISGNSFIESLRFGVAFGMANMQVQIPGGIQMAVAKKILPKVYVKML